MIDGDPVSPLLIIGMAPGREELAADKPFMGASGKLMWNQLRKKAGIDRSQCYVINTIGEWPEGINGGPTKAQLDKYWDLFNDAVRVSRPKVVLLLGGDAFHRFTGIPGGIEEWRGYLVGRNERFDLVRTVTTQGTYKTSNAKRGVKKGDPKVEKHKETVEAIWPETATWAIPTIHPAAVLRTGFNALPALAADIARVGRALRGDLSYVPEEFYTWPIPSTGSLLPIAFDIETGGLANEIITRIGVSQSGTWTAPWDLESKLSLAQALQTGSPSVAFNISFDAPRVEAAGVAVPEPWWDVMLAAAMVKPDLKKSLNYVTSLYTDTRRWKHLSEEDPEKYNALDVAKTLQLYHVLKAELSRTGQLGLFENTVMPTVPTLVRMTQRGIRVDRKVKDEWVRKLTADQVEALGKWESVAPGIKTAGTGLLKFLFKDLGLPEQYSKHGGSSSEVSGLKKLLLQGRISDRAREAIETLLKLRGIQKELKTYAEIEVHDDGCVHPGYLPAGKDEDAFGKGIAGTGRITSSNPNIQNQPQSARRMYIPHNGYRQLLAADFSQIEARIIAQLADDDELKAAIHEGLHESNQKAMGVDKTRAKNGFYGWAYGAGKRTLSRTFISKGYEVNEKDCADLLAGFDRRFKKTAAFRRRISTEVSSTYHLTNPFGARRYFMGGGSDVPAALDYLPQSSAAYIMWRILRQLEDRMRGHDAQLLATVHDEVLTETNDRPRTIEVMRDVMEQPWPELGGLVIPIEFKTGPNWGEMEKHAESCSRTSSPATSS
jgi:uracil-DNA glycosylase family 4